MSPLTNCYRCGRDAGKSGVCGWCTGERRNPFSRSRGGRRSAKHAEEMRVDDAINALRDADEDEADVDCVALDGAE